MISGKPLSKKVLSELRGSSIISQVIHSAAADTNQDSAQPDSSKVEGIYVEKEEVHNPTSEPLRNESIYDGDYEDENSTPLKSDGYEKLEFEHPALLAAFYDKSINSGVTILYPWQVEISEDLGRAKPDMMKPLKYCVCACNGSGKDAFVIAPFAVWFSLTKIKSRCIITSSSGTQLTAQTETYIRNLCQKVNEFHGEEIFKIRQRYIRCQLSGSEIRLFATDEEGKAEGYHPMEPSTEMAIVISEAKSVKPMIFKALRRCTGYNYWLEVSTPGEPNGDFYKHFTLWANKRHVTTFDCPRNLSDSEREFDKIDLGEHSALYRSKHLALFTSEEGKCVIPVEVVNRCVELSKSGVIKPSHQHMEDRVGIDLAAGGAENTVCITKGNRIRKKLYFREKDTTVTASRINAFLLDSNISKSSENIFADDGGVGHAIIDMLSNMGWRIARQNNQSAASDKKRYTNKGAQNWYRAKRLVEENIWFFDPRANDIDSYTNETNGLYTQLSNRYYKQSETQGKIALESKGEAIANGRPSPDRADAFILSLTGLSVSDFREEDSATASKGKSTPLNQRPALHSNEEVQTWHEEQVYKEYEGGKMNGDGTGAEGKAKGSLSVILNRMKPTNNLLNRN